MDGDIALFFKLRFILEVVFYKIDALFLHLNQIVKNDCPFFYLYFYVKMLQIKYVSLKVACKLISMIYQES